MAETEITQQLGEAFSNYIYGEQSGRQIFQTKFAEQLAHSLEFGDHDDKVNVFKALLNTFEKRLETTIHQERERYHEKFTEELLEAFKKMQKGGEENE